MRKGVTVGQSESRNDVEGTFEEVKSLSHIFANVKST
jgi:hypothetical protein